MWQEYNGGSTQGFQAGENIALGDGYVVAHVVGSSKDKKNWKRFWTEHSGRTWPDKCQVYGCEGAAAVGANFYIRNLKGNVWYYILPTCQSCNKDGATVYG